MVQMMESQCEYFMYFPAVPITDLSDPARYRTLPRRSHLYLGETVRFLLVLRCRDAGATPTEQGPGKGVGWGVRSAPKLLYFRGRSPRVCLRREVSDNGFRITATPPTQTQRSLPHWTPVTSASLRGIEPSRHLVFRAAAGKADQPDRSWITQVPHERIRL